MIQTFRNFPGVQAYLSEKEDGSMSWSGKGTEKNRERFYAKLGIPPERVIGAAHIHGSAIAVVGGDLTTKRVAGADALATTEPNVFLIFTVADCLPLFFYNPKKNMVALAHAGWRGIEKSILVNVVNTMGALGSSVMDVYCAIGPGIGPCHYAVGEDIAQKFSNYQKHIQGQGENIFLDLKGVVHKQFLDVGGNPAHIEISPLCTYCEQKRFFSHRRDHTEPLETMLAIIGLTP